MKHKVTYIQNLALFILTLFWCVYKYATESELIVAARSCRSLLKTVDVWFLTAHLFWYSVHNLRIINHMHVTQKIRNCRECITNVSPTTTQRPNFVCSVAQPYELKKKTDKDVFGQKNNWTNVSPIWCHSTLTKALIEIRTKHAPLSGSD